MQDLTPSEIEAILKGIGNTLTEPQSKSVAAEIKEIDITHESGNNGPRVSRVQFTQLQEELQSGAPIKHAQEFLRDIKIQIDVVLGRTRVPLQKLLSLQEGSVITLDKLAGEPVDIEADGQLIARGEVVAVDEHFGVKITHIFNNK